MKYFYSDFDLHLLGSSQNKFCWLLVYKTYKYNILPHFSSNLMGLIMNLLLLFSYESSINNCETGVMKRKKTAMRRRTENWREKRKKKGSIRGRRLRGWRIGGSETVKDKINARQKLVNEEGNVQEWIAWKKCGKMGDWLH